jgi:hypothetical protein
MVAPVVVFVCSTGRIVSINFGDKIKRELILQERIDQQIIKKEQ